MKPTISLLTVALLLSLPHASGAQPTDQPTAGALRLIAADVSPADMVEFKGMLFFRGYDAVHGAELWRSDGTAEGTVLVKDINPGPAHSNILYMTVSQDQLFFSANNGQLGQELWKSDGTAEGTVLVKDIYPGPPRPGGFFEGTGGPEYLTDFKGTLYFSARHPDWGRELFKTDGTAEGTVLVKDINPGPGDNHPLSQWIGSSMPKHLTVMGDRLYFSAYDGAHGIELWKSDGTAEGTQLVVDLYPGVQERAPFGPAEFGSNPSAMVAYQDMLYFHALDSLHEGGLWRSDGTAEGTELVRDLDPDGMSFIQSFAVVGATLFFSANSEAHGYELWKSNGTREGTVLVKDINTTESPEQHAKSSYPDFLVTYADQLYFSAGEAVHGVELWRSDGTEEGTVLVQDILPGPAGSYPISLTPMGGVLYVSAAVPGGDGRGLYAYTAPAPCIPTGDEIPGDGLDNNCNGEIDEGKFPFALQPLPELVIGTAQFFEINIPLLHPLQHQLEGVSFLANKPAWLQAEIRNNSIRLFGTTPARSWGRYAPELMAWTMDGKEASLLLSIRIDNCQNRPWYADRDGDGWGTSDHPLMVCRQPEGYVLDSGDCNDADAAIYPGATELMDGLDNNCSGEVDEDGGCYATHVVSFRQGYRPDAGTIGVRRSNPQLALGAPQENSTYNFVSLGFGGELVLELGSLLHDDGTQAPDLMVVETSWGWASRPCYDDRLAGMPETMMLEVSANGSEWMRVPGTFCRTVTVDLSPVVGSGKLPYVRFLKITDTSNPADFHPSSTGYDVDGVITCRSLFEPLQANSRLAASARGYNPDFYNELADEEDSMLQPPTYYPNPVTDKLRLQTGSFGSEPLTLRLYTLAGVLVYAGDHQADPQGGTLELSMKGLAKGMYLLRLQSGSKLQTLKIIKE